MAKVKCVLLWLFAILGVGTCSVLAYNAIQNAADKEPTEEVVETPEDDKANTDVEAGDENEAE